MKHCIVINDLTKKTADRDAADIYFSCRL
jgi:hypothetical protein